MQERLGLLEIDKLGAIWWSKRKGTIVKQVERERALMALPLHIYSRCQQFLLAAAGGWCCQCNMIGA